MEFLKNNGFTDKEINDIMEKYDDDTIEMITFNEDVISENINYFKEFGIKDIPKLMLDRVDIFYLSLEKIKELFSHYEPDSVIDALNYDALIFDEIV